MDTDTLTFRNREVGMEDTLIALSENVGDIKSIQTNYKNPPDLYELPSFHQGVCPLKGL